jgi:cytochrome d ubiquinol oxidase subunit II
MELNQLWFGLIALLYVGFFFLEGFDFGVGMLVPFLGRSDSERGTILRSIGPHWDANEVWLITAAGATFAAFPRWYAAMFSGLYPLLLILLLALIGRGTALEFRSRMPEAGWRNAWTAVLAVSSFLAAGAVGALLGTLLHGIPIDAKGVATGRWDAPWSAESLICGAAAVVLALLHGANFLNLKLGGDLRECARIDARSLWISALAVLLITTVFAPQILRSAALSLWILMLVCVLLSGILLWVRRYGWAFVFGGAAAIGFVASFFLALYPRVMVSSTDPDFSLTIAGASSSPYTLQVMTVIAVVLLPVVIAYQAWSYWVFRRRISAGGGTEGY